MWEVQIGTFLVEEKMRDFIRQIEKKSMLSCETKNSTIPGAKNVVLKTKFKNKQEADAIAEYVKRHCGVFTILRKEITCGN